MTVTDFEVWYVLKCPLSYVNDGLEKIVEAAKDVFRKEPSEVVARIAGRFFKAIEERKTPSDWPPELESILDMDLDLTIRPKGRIITKPEVQALLNPSSDVE